jgi:hypothetical protein
VHLWKMAIGNGSMMTAQSSTAMRRLFAFVENRYGGLAKFMDTDDRSEVITREGTLEAEDLKRLMCHEATALHVRGFFDKDGEMI